MKIIAIGDTHFGFEAGRSKESRNLVETSFFDSFNYIVDQAQKSDTDMVLHAGDIFNRSKPKARIFKQAFDIIERRILNKNIDFGVTPGNHDKSHFPDSLFSYFTHGFHIFNKLSVFRKNDISIIGFPFERSNPKLILQKAAKIALQYPRETFLLICHQLFDGATFGPHNFTFYGQWDSLNTQNLPENIKLVISGHIHKSQVLQKNRVVYTGSTERTSFVEIIEPKGYLEIIIENDFIDVNFKEIPSYPMQVIEVDISKDRFNISQIEALIINPLARILVRIVGKKLNRSLRYQLEWNLSRKYPLVSISPKQHDRVLTRLYNSKTSFDHFHFRIPNLSLTPEI